MIKMTEKEKMNNVIQDIQNNEDVSGFIICAIVTRNGEKQMITSITGEARYVERIWENIDETLNKFSRNGEKTN